MTKTTSKSGRYLYAVVFSSKDCILNLHGIDDMPVFTIGNGGVSAVVSKTSHGAIRPERRKLATHQRVLKQLMQESTPLPMSFGIIADGPNAVKAILSRNRDALSSQLNRVQEKMEMGLRVTWDVPNIFEYFVHTHQELREARDRFFASQREPTHEDKIELGRMFDRILNEDRESHTERVEEVLSAYCSEIKASRRRNEREVMNLACLVDRHHESLFVSRVFEAAKLFDDNFSFDYNGPWAPHNFVDIDLKLEI